jgi:hypothetical protein
MAKGRFLMRFINLRQRLILAGLLVLVCAPAGAVGLPDNTPWKDPSSVRLEVDFPGNDYHASWELFRCACGDLLVLSELSEPGEVVRGEMVLVANRAVLMRGYDPEHAQQISFDAPGLMMQLALRLLERSAPAGPAPIDKKTDVAVEDKVNFINLDTGAAAGTFPAPWSVKGSIWPQNDTERRFDLLFRFVVADPAGGEARAGEMRLSGNAQYAPGEFPVAADSELSGWDLSWRDENDAAAAPAAELATLEQLRALLREDQSRGDQVPDD